MPFLTCALASGDVYTVEVWDGYVLPDLGGADWFVEVGVDGEQIAVPSDNLLWLTVTALSPSSGVGLAASVELTPREALNPDPAVLAATQPVVTSPRQRRSAAAREAHEEA